MEKPIQERVETLVIRLERIERTLAFQKSCFRCLWGALTFLAITLVQYYFNSVISH